MTVYNDPFSIFDELFFRDIAHNSKFSSCLTAEYPIDIRSTEKEINIDIAAIKIKKEDVKIDLDGDKLIVSYTKPTDEKTDQVFHVRKIKTGSFNFAWKLSPTLDADKLVAKFEGGLLTITIPVKEESIPKKRTVNIE